MENQNGRKGEEAPPRTYGVHWPSPPEEPVSDAAVPEKDKPATGKPADSRPAAAPPTARPPVATSPASAPATSAPPAPVIPPLPPTARPPAAAMPSAPPAAAMPSAPPAAAMPSAPPETTLPSAPPTPQPVQPAQPIAQPAAPEPVYVAPPVSAPEPVFAPEPVYVPVQADTLIPVPTETPGLRVDPLTSPEIPVMPAAVAPPAEDTSGLSRREMRKLREQATARIGESSDSMSRIEEAAAMAAATSAVLSPYAATGQPAALAPSALSPSALTPSPVPESAPYVPLSTTLPGVPAAAAEMAAITGRLDIIEATRTSLAPTQPSGPTVAQLRAMEEASRAAMARDAVLESTVPGMSTTGGVPISGHSLIMSNVPTDVPSALSAMNETGEIIVTGQIVLPAGVAQTGTDMRRFDTAEIDVVSEQEPQTGNVGNLAPVSATRAVSAFSSPTASSLPPRAGSHRLPMALALIAAGLAVAVVGVFVANIFLKFF